MSLEIGRKAIPPFEKVSALLRGEASAVWDVCCVTWPRAIASPFSTQSEILVILRSFIRALMFLEDKTMSPKAGLTRQATYLANQLFVAQIPTSKAAD